MNLADAPGHAAMELARRVECEASHLYFTRYFHRVREDAKFHVNWHHHWLADVVDQIIAGRLKNVIVNVPPGSTKTTMFSINLMARGLAVNPWSRFIHISYSDDLVALNSSTTKEVVQSDEFQAKWPMGAKDDSDAKKRWNIEIEGRTGGGVYAVALGGGITGFRAGRMSEGFQGAIIIDDPIKPGDALSDSKRNDSNDKLINTVKSRRALPSTPTIIIMQRVNEEDPTGFALAGKMGLTDWHHVVIPALLDDGYVAALPPKYRMLVEQQGLAQGPRDEKGRFSYWPYKEPLDDLLLTEVASEYVFNGQYMQRPIPLGGGIFKGAWYPRYTRLPRLRYRAIYADTASKTSERNDFSVFQCWGLGDDNRIYLIDQVRGKWEAWQLEEVAEAFWLLHKEFKLDPHCALRGMFVEDKSSGTGLIQNIRKRGGIPITGIERTKDKLTRAMDVQSYYKTGYVCLPQDNVLPLLTRYERREKGKPTGEHVELRNGKPYIAEFIAEHEAFTPDDTHKWDDQIDPEMDAVNDMLAANKVGVWVALGKQA